MPFCFGELRDRCVGRRGSCGKQGKGGPEGEAGEPKEEMRAHEETEPTNRRAAISDTIIGRGIRAVLCTNVTVRGLTIRSHGPNNDGCNPESSRDVLIEDTLFDTGDDCIAIKSARNADSRRLATPSKISSSAIAA